MKTLSLNIKAHWLNISSCVNFLNFRNISSLQHHFLEFHTFLTAFETKFDIIVISDSGLKRTKKDKTNTDCPKFNIDHCDAECANGETLYSKHIAYKWRRGSKVS